MDNSAFSKLVRDRAHTKSTKEIARDAVQQEFQKKHKGKRQRRGGYSNQGYSSDEEDGDHKNKKKKFRQDVEKNEDEILKPQFRMKANGKETSQKKSKEEATSKYRDRAKERREGDGDALPPSKESIFDELLEEELDAAEDNAFQADKGDSWEEEEEEEQALFCENTQEARQFVEERLRQEQSIQASSSLGREMLEYLQFTYLTTSADTSTITTSAAGQTLQGSVLTFSTEANPGDRNRAWELPKEQTFAGQAGEATALEKLSSAPPELLQKMETVLTRQSARERQQLLQKSNPKGEAATKEKEHGGRTVGANDEDSDDDIFGTVGSYDPLQGSSASKAAEAMAVKNDDDSQEKKSFFGDNIVREKCSGTNNAEAALQKDEEDNAVAAQTAQTLRGFATSTARDYSYGEEMDVDFDGRFDDDGDKKSKKKKKKKSDDEDD